MNKKTKGNTYNIAPRSNITCKTALKLHKKDLRLSELAPYC